MGLVGPEMPLIEGHTACLNLWDPKITNTAVENITWQEYRPVSQINSTSTIEFSVPNSGSQYFDLRKTRLMMKLKVVNKDGSALEATDQVWPINLIMNTMFSQVDLLLQQKQVTRLTAPGYALKSYVDTLLHHQASAKNGFLQAQLWHVDTPNAFDNLEVAPQGDQAVMGVSNSGAVKRYAMTKLSAPIQLEGNLNVDFMQQRRYLLNGVPLLFRLWQSPESFRLMTAKEGAEYRIEIIDIVLKMAAIDVLPEVLVGHSEALKRAPATYNFAQSDIKTFAVSKGQYSFTADNLFQGSVPSLAYVFLVPSEAFNGSFKRNPFNMVHADASYISFTVDNRDVPSSALTPDYDKGMWTDCFISMLTASRNYDVNVGNEIQMSHYPQGFTIYGFDIDSMDSLNYLPMPKKGNCRINIQFSKALTESMNLIIYSKYPSCVMINAARGVTV